MHLKNLRDWISGRKWQRPAISNPLFKSLQFNFKWIFNLLGSPGTIFFKNFDKQVIKAICTLWCNNDYFFAIIIIHADAWQINLFAYWCELYLGRIIGFERSPQKLRDDMETMSVLESSWTVLGARDKTINMSQSTIRGFYAAVQSAWFGPVCCPEPALSRYHTHLA